jgi:hypothetical protein
VTWLITGAAGYIGAGVLEAFTMAGIPANLSVLAPAGALADTYTATLTHSSL